MIIFLICFYIDVYWCILTGTLYSQYGYLKCVWFFWLNIYIFSLCRFSWKRRMKEEIKCLSIFSFCIVNLFFLWNFISLFFYDFPHMKIWTWTTILQYDKRNIYIICVLFSHVIFFKWIIWFFLIRNLIIFTIFYNY